MLTNDKLNNIHKLNSDEVIQILHECVEYIGMADIETASRVLGISKRRLYQKLTPSNHLKLGIRIIPFINLL